MSNPRSTASVLGIPLHAMLVPIPFTCFIGTYISDRAYADTYILQWANFSAWLLFIGLMVAIPAVITGLIDFFCDARIREIQAAWIYGWSSALALILSIANSFVHTRDAFTSVVPAGLTLSGIVVLISIVSGWNGLRLVYVYGVGVRSQKEDRT
jgi:uncharacterized membrane protein